MKWVVISESESHPDISETLTIFDIGLPEILGKKVFLEIYFLYILTIYLQSGCDGTIVMYYFIFLLTETIIF